MATPTPTRSARSLKARRPGLLIGGAFAVDASRALPGAGGGLPAFAAIDRRSGDDRLMGVQARPMAPARANVLPILLANPMEGMLGPLAHGLGHGAGGVEAWFVICRAPPGAALLASPLSRPAAEARPWTEAELLECLLRPAAHTLERLYSRRVTHRAIRPDNLFRSGPGDPVVLGCAWAAPPASMQPALFEPPYSAMCAPSARGEGSIADDVYALGVTVLVLALGRLPLAGQDAAAIVRRKLELGSYAALAGDERLSPMIADLVRGMLAEDPEHRPPPALLTDPVAARARRVAARPPRRGQRPLPIGQQTAWNARSLAYALASDPDQAVRNLRNGAVDRWVRRDLGDSALATRLEDALRPRGAEADTEDQRADGLLVMRAGAALDPLAPLCWRGMALWPDGIGPALAAATPERTELLQQVVAHEAIYSWAAARPERCDAAILRMHAHDHRNVLGTRGAGGGMPRLRYTLNPLLACTAKSVQGHFVARIVDVLPALEAAASVPEYRKLPPVDQEIAAFLAARSEQRLEIDLANLSNPGHPAQAALAQLRLLAGLQLRLGGRKVPALAGWLAEQARPALALWRNRERRERIGRELDGLTGAGQLPAILGLLQDPQGQAVDAQEYLEAIQAVAGDRRGAGADCRRWRCRADGGRTPHRTGSRAGARVDDAGGRGGGGGAVVMARDPVDAKRSRSAVVAGWAQCCCWPGWAAARWRRWRRRPRCWPAACWPRAWCRC